MISPDVIRLLPKAPPYVGLAFDGQWIISDAWICQADETLAIELNAERRYDLTAAVQKMLEAGWGADMLPHVCQRTPSDLRCYVGGGVHSYFDARIAQMFHGMRMVRLGDGAHDPVALLDSEGAVQAIAMPMRVLDTNGGAK